MELLFLILVHFAKWFNFSSCTYITPPLRIEPFSRNGTLQTNILYYFQPRMRGPFLEVLLHKDEKLITQQCNQRNLELTSLSDCEKQILFDLFSVLHDGETFMFGLGLCWAVLKKSSIKLKKTSMKWNKKSTNTQMIRIQVQNQK